MQYLSSLLLTAVSVAQTGKRVIVVYGTGKAANRAFDSLIASQSTGSVGWDRHSRTVDFYRVGRRQAGYIHVAALWDNPAGRMADFVGFEADMLGSVRLCGDVDHAIRQRDDWSKAGRPLASSGISAQIVKVAQPVDAAKLMQFVDPNNLPAPATAPERGMPEFEIKPRETAGVHVERAVNGFIVSCSAFEGPQFRGLSFVAADHNDLDRVIKAVQDKQRAAILEFFAPKAAEATEKC